MPKLPKIKVSRLFNFLIIFQPRMDMNDHELLQWAKAGVLILKIKFVLIRVNLWLLLIFNL